MVYLQLCVGAFFCFCWHLFIKDWYRRIKKQVSHLNWWDQMLHGVARNPKPRLIEIFMVVLMFAGLFSSNTFIYCLGWVLMQIYLFLLEDIPRQYQVLHRAYSQIKEAIHPKRGH